MNSLGWSRRDPDIPVNTSSSSSSTPLLSRLQSLNPFSDRGYVRLPTHEGPGAPLPAPTRREEEEGWFARKSLQCPVKQHLRKLPGLQRDGPKFLRWPRAHRMRPAAARFPPAAPRACLGFVLTDCLQSVAGTVCLCLAASTSSPPSSSSFASRCCLRPSSSPRRASLPSCKSTPLHVAGRFLRPATLACGDHAARLGRTVIPLGRNMSRRGIMRGGQYRSRSSLLHGFITRAWRIPSLTVN
jgi:hypothetical protein